MLSAACACGLVLFWPVWATEKGWKKAPLAIWVHWTVVDPTLLFAQVALKQNNTLQLNVTPKRCPPVDMFQDEEEDTRSVHVDVEKQQVQVTVTNTKPPAEEKEECVVMDEDEDVIKPTTDECKASGFLPTRK